MQFYLRKWAAILRRILIKNTTFFNYKSEGLRLYRISSQAGFLEHQARTVAQLAGHTHYLDMLKKLDKQRFFVHGYSYPAGRESSFLIERGSDGIINWRETVNCTVTGFNNRMRAIFHLFDIEMEAYPDSEIYITEQITPIYTYFKNKYSRTVGSEFLGGRCAFGSVDENGIRNETITALTFPDQTFDILISLDVLEHVPDYKTAFKECARVLREGGKMMWSVPFAVGSFENIVRAKVDNGEVVHILPPEYHGDPLSSDGVLCFQHFGWEMLEQMREAGFRDVYALCFHSTEFGYLGGEQLMFVANK